jgi:hypothetical protein
MEHFYRDHRIEFAVKLGSDTWRVSVFICYSEGPQNTLVTFPMKQVFETYKNAIEVSLAAAKKWIDGRLSNPERGLTWL